jgi:hypothetical protein
MENLLVGYSLCRFQLVYENDFIVVKYLMRFYLLQLVIKTEQNTCISVIIRLITVLFTLKLG